MRPLVADELLEDPRLREGRRLILEAIADHQQNLLGPRPADPTRAIAYQQTIQQFSNLRGGALYYPYLASGIGRGPLVELADGSVKYDMINGIGVHYLGHGSPKIIAAMLDAAAHDVVMQGNLQQDRQTVATTQLLIDAANQSGGSLAHAIFTTSGAMANENALKILFQKHAPATRLLAFEHCFAGRTLALAQVTDKAAYRIGLPQTIDVDYVPFFDATQPKESTDRAVRVLRQHLARFPRQHAAMVVELIQGEGGYYAGDRDFFISLLTTLREANVGIFFDEVQTFGRTTRPFAFQHFGLDAFADVVSIGKLTQLCATLFTDACKPGPGLISQTFTASTSSLFAGHTIIKTLLDEPFFGNDGKNARVHQAFVERFEEIGRRHPLFLRGPFGIGGMIAFTPFDGSPDVVKRLLMALYDAGVIAFMAGSEPTRVRFLPPVGVMTNQDIDAVCEILEQSLVKISQSATAP